jgi:cysteine desulfurase
VLLGRTDGDHDATVGAVTTYLDHAATSPPRPETREALLRWLDAANASATHTPGQAARVAIEESREQVARALGCSPHEVVFTSGGTEADNLALKGVVWAARERMAGVPHLVTSAVEHAAVRDTARWLAERGDVDLTEVAPGPDGRVDPEAVLAAVRDDTVLVSVMTANNELGAVNDVAAIAAALAARELPLHTDAVQAIATLDVEVTGWDLAALAASAHKFGGPQGVGVCVLRRGLPVVPLAHGGGQDRGVRSGTFAAALVAACGAAMTAAVADRSTLRARLRRLSDRLAAGVTELDGVTRNGPVDPDQRLASHVHLSLEGVDAEALALTLDAAGIAASAGSACGSGSLTPSHVVQTVGLPGTPLRLSLGWTTTDEDVDAAIAALADVLPRLRARRAGWAASLASEPT